MRSVRLSVKDATMSHIQSDSIRTPAPDGHLQGPHWSPLKDADAKALGNHALESLDELLAEVDLTSIPLAMRAEILSSGLNVALHRWPKVIIEPLNLPKSPAMQPAWKPS